VFTHVIGVTLFRCALDRRPEKVVTVAGITELGSRLGNEIEVLEDRDGLSRVFMFFKVLFDITISLYLYDG
jgi:hypothetical protein